MSFDPSGTSPGLTPQEAPKEKILNIRCKAPGCLSVEAVEVPNPSKDSGFHMYRCVKCKNVSTTSVGGHFPF